MRAWLLLAASLAGAEPSLEPLTLEGAVREAVAASPQARAAERRLAEAALEEPALLAELDPVFAASFTRANDRTPRAAPAFEGSYSRLDSWEAGFSQSTLLGTRARLVFRNDRLVNPTPFRPLDPTVDSRLNLELTQPLWRYFLGRPDTARRRRARAGAAAAELEWRRAREQAAAEAARAFLELRHARALAAIKEESVSDAKRLLSKSQEKARYGLVEGSDLLQARAALELRQTELTIARSGVESAAHALAAALGREEAGALPVSMGAVPAPGAAPGISEEEALSARPDVESARRRRERAEWDLRVTRLDTLPELNLSAAYGFGGLASRYSSSWRDLSSWDHGAVSAGLNLAVPLSFRRERLARGAARLRLEAAEAEEEAVRVQARRQWRDAGEALALAARRLEAGRRLLELERAKLKAEEGEFRRGRSSTDLLIRFQQDIRQARETLLRAETDEVRARVEAALARGALVRETAP